MYNSLFAQVFESHRTHITSYYMPMAKTEKAAIAEIDGHSLFTPNDIQENQQSTRPC